MSAGVGERFGIAAHIGVAIRSLHRVCADKLPDASIIIPRMVVVQPRGIQQLPGVAPLRRHAPARHQRCPIRRMCTVQCSLPGGACVPRGVSSRAALDIKQAL